MSEKSGGRSQGSHVGQKMHIRLSVGYIYLNSSCTRRRIKFHVSRLQVNQFFPVMGKG